jgi:predicted N-acetyltransferase YhbS
MLGTHRILLLGPLAVQPDLRGKGYGKELVSSGLSYANSFNWPVILVSGEVDYYPKFGFVPAAPYGIEWPGFIELERLQFFELEDGFLASLSGQHLPVCPVG